MKTLNDVINAVQHETQLSRSQLSLKIGKSRNYLSEVLRSGVSPKKEQELINLLLDLVDDEVTMLRREIETLKEKKMKRHMELIEYENKYGNIIDELNKTIATKNLFIDGLDMENKGLMDNIDYLNREVNLLNSEKEKLIKDSYKLKSKLQGQIDCNKAVSEANEELSSKLKNIQEDIRSSNEIAMKDIELQEKNIKEKSIINKEKNKEITKNRILTASIIGLVAIFSVYAFLR